MDLSRMRDILTPHLALISENIVFNGEVGMVHGDHTVFSLLMRQKPPFTINDHRFGIILSGEAHINFNLQDRHVTAGTLVYIGPGTIINPIRLSDDLRIYGMALFADALRTGTDAAGLQRSGARLPTASQRGRHQHSPSHSQHHLACRAW